MKTQFTPEQILFFLNAAFLKAGEEQQPTLLARLLAYKLPVDFRYRLEVLQRQLIAAIKPAQEEKRDLYDAYRSTLAVVEGDEDEDAKSDAAIKLEADLAKVDSTPIEFTGKLILATQLEKLSDEVSEFLSMPGVMGQWLFPFIEDNLDSKK